MVRLKVRAPAAWTPKFTITEGFTEGMGIDVKALLSGLLGAKVATGSDDKSQPSSTVININTADGKDAPEVTDSPED